MLILSFLFALTMLTSAQNLTIVGGTSVSQSEYDRWYPWLAQVPGCTGTVVNRRFVLSAAHCSSLSVGRTVYVGSNTRSRGTRYTIRSVERNPNWRSGASDRRRWDHAVIRLDRDVTSSTGARLHGIHSDTDRRVSGRTTFHVGWGRTDPNQSSSTVTTLQQTTGRVETCSSSRTGQLCTRGARMCNGDSGGPVVIGTNRDVVYGALSGGASGCGDLAFYSPTFESRSWLRTALGLSIDGEPLNLTFPDDDIVTTPVVAATDCMTERQKDSARELLAAVLSKWSEARAIMVQYSEEHTDDDDLTQQIWESIEDVDFQVDDLEELVTDLLNLECSSCQSYQTIIENHIDETAVHMTNFIRPDWETASPFNSVVGVVSAMKAMLFAC